MMNATVVHDLLPSMQDDAQGEETAYDFFHCTPDTLFYDIEAIVLVDLDGTVLDDQNNCSPAFLEAARKATDAGFLLGWCSNTSASGLRSWERELGIDPVFQVNIVEGGVRTWAPPYWFRKHRGRSFHEHVGSPNAHFGSLLEKLKCWARQKEWWWIESHPSTWVRQNTSYAAGYEALVCVDVTRIASFTCEVRRIESDGMLVVDPKLTSEVSNKVREIACELGLDPSALEAGDGFVDLPHPDATKGAAVRYLRDYVVPSCVPIYMIGNGSNDISCANIPGVRLIAVANACTALRDVADFVTEGEYSDGVAEFLNRLAAKVPTPTRSLAVQVPTLTWVRETPDQADDSLAATPA